MSAWVLVAFGIIGFVLGCIMVPLLLLIDLWWWDTHRPPPRGPRAR